jgi:hypothetical protein
MCYTDILEHVKRDKLFTFVLLSFNSDNHRAWQCWWQNLDNLMSMCNGCICQKHLVEELPLHVVFSDVCMIRTVKLSDL